MTDQIKQFILPLMEKKSKLPKGVDIDSFNYIDTGYVDSIGLIKFVLEIETQYDIEISDADMVAPEFKTVGGLVALIQAKIKDKAKND